MHTGNLLVPLLFLSINLILGKDLRVCLPQLGCLKGTDVPGFQTEKYEAFRGVPYAMPPVGELRWKNPMPIAPWKGDMNATTYKEKCLQKNYNIPGYPIAGSEDCLYLNVYRPAENHMGNPLPVLVYIHPGDFFSGCPNLLQPAYFMDTQQVILVEIGYRLGPFGFLSTGDEQISGNFGLKDQNLALRWVQQYISAFGGDPKMVTLFGHSAGGSSVHYHMISRASQGLFSRAMSLSGLAIAPNALPLSEPLAQVRILAENCGIANAGAMPTSELAKQLRSVEALNLLNAGDVFRTWNIFPYTNFRPVIEPGNGEMPFLTDCAVKAQLTGDYAKVPWLIGTVPKAGESAFALAHVLDDEKLRKEFNADINSALATMMELPGERSGLVAEVLPQYLAGSHELNNETYDALAELLGDYYYHYTLYQTAKSHAEHSDAAKNPLYMYYFDYKGSYTFHKGVMRNFGVTHVDDALYTFNMPALFPEGVPKQSADAKFIQRFVQLLVDFAKTGRLQSPANIGQCSVDKFKDDNICDYLKLENTADGFQESISNAFEVKAMDLWQQIIGY